jgi:hypothetical protein
MGSVKSVFAAVLLATTLFVTGCATVGEDFATHNVDQIEIGETTDLVVRFDGNGKVASYVYNTTNNK